MNNLQLFHGPPKFVIFEKAPLGKPDLFVCCLLVWFLAKQTNRPEKYFYVNLDSFI